MKFLLISVLFLSLCLSQLASSQIFIPFANWAGITTPALSISDGATYSYGSVAINTNIDKTFVVTNTTTLGVASNIVGAAFGDTRYTFKGGSYPGTGGTCSTSLMPAATCTIVVTANSASAGTFNDTITLDFKNSKNTGTFSATRPVTATFTSTPTNLGVISPDFIKVNDCVAVTLQSQDNVGNPLNVAADTTVTLVINNLTTSNFYTTSACGTTTTTRIITSGTNSVVAYFRTTTANQSGILVATAPGLVTGTKNVTITAAPTKLKLIAAPQIKTSTCTALSVNTVDANNYFSNAGSNITVNMTTNGANIYYSDSGCTASITSTIILSGTYEKIIYTSNATIQTITLTATDNAAVLTPDSANVNFLTTLTWWNTSWTKRMRIEINNTDQATAFTNQPVLVKLTPTNVNYANLQASGADMRFVASDDTTVLNHEVETWSSGGTSEIWVRIPTIAASSDTGYFFMYFNNNAAADAQNKTGVWTNFWSVWHLNEDPAGSAPQYLDSTSGARNGTKVATPTRVVGSIGYAAGLNAGTDAVDVSSDLSVALGVNSTFSAWMRTTQVGNNTMWQAPGLTGIEQAGGGNEIFFGWLDAGGLIGITAGNGANAKSTFVVNNGAWRHVTMNRTSGTGAVRFFINGVFQNTANSETGNKTTYFDLLGEIGDTGGTPVNYNGDMDEVRIYNSVQSDAQIRGDFKFMMNTHLFYNSTEVWP
ncbi:MAG: LamG domain-containing protein [Bdellovibrionota bacterium]